MIKTYFQIIGLVGSEGRNPLHPNQSGSGTGKNEVANYLTSDCGYVHLKFATMLRQMFYKHYGLPMDMIGDKDFEFSCNGYQYNDCLSDDKTINQHMIEYAEWARSIDSNVFIVPLLEVILNLIETKSHNFPLKIVVSDVRQFNEYLCLRALNMTLWNVIRENPSQERQDLDCQLLTFANYAINNNDSIEDLHHWINESLNQAAEYSCVISDQHIKMMILGYQNKFPFVHQ